MRYMSAVACALLCVSNVLGVVKTRLVQYRQDDTVLQELFGG